METLTRKQLTVALAARQLLLERRRLAPAEAIRRITPMQGQHSTSPFIGLAARLDGFARADLEAAIDERGVVKTTIHRLTLHLAAAAEYPAYAQLTRQPWMRKWRKTYAHLDEAKVSAELRKWLREPKTNAEIRERVSRYEGVTGEAWTPIVFARTLLPLVQLPPAGHWNDRSRPCFVVDPRPLPAPEDAAALVLERYLAAFGPASRRDVAAWAGATQGDFAAAFERVETVSYRDESDTELLDLPGQPLPPASTPLPVRFLGRWEQALLAYADRERVIPPAVAPLKLTLSGDQTLTVEGRVAASWSLDRGRRVVRLSVTPHVEIGRAARAEIREEALRTARFCAPDAAGHEVAGL